ncbi:MAG: hypothetical protein LBO05_04335 [Deltaproteobacteria bacterium]|jgi:hypothetical protein|nr:hypothetical protein [Deltaproteobacteria bacterium]
MSARPKTRAAVGRTALARLLLPAVLAAVLAPLLPACGLSRPYPFVRSFSLDPGGGPVMTDKAARPLLVQVASSGAASQYETKKLVHKIGPNEFREDFYSELVGLPSRLVAEAAAGWLDAGSRRLRAAAGLGAQPPDLLLDLYVVVFQGNYGLPSPAAEIEVRLTLTDQRRRRPPVLLAGTYKASSPLDPAAPDQPAELAAALGRALGKILTDAQTDIERGVP